MNATRGPVAEPDSDLERTAELPLLDAAALEAAEAGLEGGYADTWVAPGPTAPAAERASAAADDSVLSSNNSSNSSQKAGNSTVAGQLKLTHPAVILH